MTSVSLGWNYLGRKSSKDRKWYWEENISWCTNSECSIERCLDWTLLLHFSFWCFWCFRFTKDYRLRRTTFKGPISLLGNLYWVCCLISDTFTLLKAPMQSSRTCKYNNTCNWWHYKNMTYLMLVFIQRHTMYMLRKEERKKTCF